MKKKLTWRDCAVTLAILAAASALSFALKGWDQSDRCVPMLFIFAVFLISRWTDGYLYGAAASLIAVILVNYAFTFPYFQFNFTITGYPVSFLILFATAVMTSTLTSQAKEREQTRLEAEKEKMRGNLLRAVSHDLRTPLTAIEGVTAALLENGDKIPKEQQRELLLESRENAEWLIRMVENLLSVTRVNGGAASLQKTPEPAEELLGEAARKFGIRFPDASLEVSAPEELLMVPADAILIEQVLLNLLENAVLHGGRTDGISLSVRREGETAVFSVRDHGRGIPLALLPRIFDGSLTPDSGEGRRGMGIGLSVCRSIVQAHGGAITAKNAAGGGAEFRFTLPLEEESL